MIGRDPGGRRGAALILCVSMLFVLSVLAVSFGRLMIPERDASRNFELAVQARLAAHAGIEMAFARLQADARSGELDEIAADWRYMGEDADRDFVNDADEDIDLDGLVERHDCPLADAVSPSYPVSGKPYSGTLAHPSLPTGWSIRYKLRVYDTQGLLNLNFFEFQPSTRPKNSSGDRIGYWGTARLLTGLGWAIEKQYALGRDIVAEMAYTDAAGEDYTGWEAFVEYRYGLPGQRLTTRRQLLPILARGEEDLELLAPFVTCASWQDENAFAKRRDLAGDWAGRDWPDRWMEPTELVQEPGVYPVHINTAPRAVLSAVWDFTGAYKIHRSTQRYWVEKTRNNGGYRDNTGARMSAAKPGHGDYRDENSWSWWTGGLGWYYGRGGGWWWGQRILERRRGEERDLNGTNWPEGAAEETTTRNGWLETGPFRRPQDLEVWVGRHIQPWYASIVPAISGEDYLDRYNNDYAPTMPHYQPNNRRRLFYGAWGFADRTSRFSRSGQFCYRPRGIYEVTALGQVVDEQGDVVASHETRTVARIFRTLDQDSQRDFLTMPRRNATYRSGEPYPGEPWGAGQLRNWMLRTVTIPENIADHRDGSDTPEPGRADPWIGAIVLEPPDVVPGATLLFAADYDHTRDATVAPTAAHGRAVVGRNDHTRPTQEDRLMAADGRGAASDLHPDGLYHEIWRARTTAYDNPGFESMHPDRGALEFWVKFDDFQHGGELVTAFFPADPTVEAFSTEGIVFRVALNYVHFKETPKAEGAFHWFRRANARKYIHPIRWYSWGWNGDAERMRVPVLVAERTFYTAQTDMATGLIHGRDATFAGLGTTASFAGGKWVFSSTNFVNYEYYPLHNWSKDRMWHHVRVVWRGGTEVELYVDGVRGPFRWSWPATRSNDGDAFTLYWGRQQTEPEICVGGVRKIERWVGNRTMAPTYASTTATYRHRWPDPFWLAGNSTTGHPWIPNATIDQLRIHSDPDHVPDLQRYPSGGFYQNLVQLPSDATRLLTVTLNQRTVQYDPNNRRDAGWKHGHFIGRDSQPRSFVQLWTKRNKPGGERIQLARADLVRDRGYDAYEAVDVEWAGGAPLDVAVESDEQILYRVSVRRHGNLNTTPIFDSITFRYLTGSIEILLWEESL